MNKFFLSSFFIFFLFSKAYSLVVGNPSDPGLFENGVFTKNKKVASFRASYLYDNIYKVEYTNNLQLQAKTNVKMKVLASILTLNFYNRLDLYGILGKANYEFLDIGDALLLTDDNFAWGAGLKLLLYKGKNIDFSFDGKYFSTKQHPSFFLIEKLVYTFEGSNTHHLEEIEGSLALSYKTNLLIPYVGATFVYTLNTDEFPHSRIVPDPLVKILSRGEDLVEYETGDLKPKMNFGAVIGISIINKRKNATINIETRVIDQNAFAFIGTLRF